MIDVRELWRTYQPAPDITVHALRGITVTVMPGEFVAIMGPSGSGKSTLMNVIGALDVATSGTYHLDGTPIDALSEDDLSDLRNQKIGFVFQAFNLVPRMTALDNVAMPLMYAGVGRRERLDRAADALASVGMGSRMHHVPTELSGGQQQRVAVARAIVTDPPLLLADEPTGNLDTHSTDDVLAIFDGLAAQGRTIVLITHEDDVARRAGRILRIDDGRITSDRRRRAPGVGAHV
ncbi:MAG: ABC transporter ATP-binding protein [Solirubrobacteraceae bacterium]|nr:ABC transporter ATP-binding protein [Solirubrobacteraceae bacterium]